MISYNQFVNRELKKVQEKRAIAFIYAGSMRREISMYASIAKVRY